MPGKSSREDRNEGTKAKAKDKKAAKDLLK